MSRALMSGRCPGAQALGTATLSGWRFVINPEGFGSIAQRPGARVYGVLWRLTARDLAAINAYESVDAGLYLRRRLMVREGGRGSSAITYIARWKGEGPPRRATSHWWSTRRVIGSCPSPTFVRLRVGRRQDGAELAPGTRGN